MNSDFNSNNFLYSEEPLNLHQNNNNNKNKNVKKEGKDNDNSTYMDFVDFDNVDFDITNLANGQNMNYTDSNPQKVFEQLMSKNNSSNTNFLNEFNDINMNNVDSIGSNMANIMPNLSANYSPIDGSNSSKSNVVNDDRKVANDFNFYMDQMMNQITASNTGRASGKLNRFEDVQALNAESNNNSFINELVDVFDDNMNITNDEPFIQQGLLTNIDVLRANDIHYWRNCLNYVENVKFGKSPDFTRSDFVKEQEKIKQMSAMRDSESDDYVKIPEDP